MENNTNFSESGSNTDYQSSYGENNYQQPYNQPGAQSNYQQSYEQPYGANNYQQNYYGAPHYTPQQHNTDPIQVISIVSLVLGICSFTICCCFGFVPGTVGFILGLVGIFKSTGSKGFAIAGTITSLLGIIISITLIVYSFANPGQGLNYMFNLDLPNEEYNYDSYDYNYNETY